MSKAEIGIIGGSGLYSMPGFEARDEVALDTPFGPPSDSYAEFPRQHLRHEVPGRGAHYFLERRRFA